MALETIAQLPVSRLIFEDVSREYVEENAVKASIRRIGQIEPIVVRRLKGFLFKVLDGKKRVKALRSLGRYYIHAVEYDQTVVVSPDSQEKIFIQHIL